MECKKLFLKTLVSLMMLVNLSLCESSIVSSNNLPSVMDMQLKAYTTQLKYESMLEAEKELKNEIRGSRDQYFWLSVVLVVGLSYSATK